MSRKQFRLIGSKLEAIGQESKPDQEIKPAKAKAKPVPSAEPAPETELKAEVENDSNRT